MKSAKMLCLIAILTAILPLARVLAQVPQGRILGVVTDSTGAAIPAATVTLKNDSTGITRTTQTTPAGDYVFLYLDSGTYTVTVQKAGFDTAVYPGVKLDIGEQRRLDAQLKVGQVTTTVKVTAAAVNVQTDTSVMGSIVSQREVADLPIQAREFSLLALPMPGVREEPSYTRTGAYIGGNFATAIDVGGTSWSQNGYKMDGIDNFFYAWGGPAMNPSLDSIQEVRIDRNLFQAENGSTGALVQTVTKGGTNNFHGSAWEFVRNYKMNAGDYITHQPDTLKRNQFGASLGGPIVKEKAFFFFNWESQRSRADAQQFGTVLTDKARTGDLTEYPETPIDPQTGLPFQGKIIPTDRLDPVALAYVNALMPHANLPGITNNAYNFFSSKDDWNQYLTRLDYRPSQKDNLYLRLAMSPRKVLESGNFGVNGPLQANSFNFYNGGLGWTRSLTPQLVAETNFGFHHERLLLDAASLHNPALRIQGFEQPSGFREADSISVPGYFDMGDYGYPMGFDHRDFVFSQKVSWIRGKHLIKAGFTGEWLRMFQDLYPEYYTWENFSTTYTSSAPGDFLLGLPSSGYNRLVFPRWDMRERYFSGYVQDDWKIAPYLTLNLGLRYDLIGAPYDAHNIWGSFSVDQKKIVVAGTSIVSTLVNPVLLNAELPYIITADKTNLPVRTLAFGDHNNFGPRIGFAWRPFKNNRTVVRGGYGVFYIPNEGIQNNACGSTPPYYQELDFFNTTPTPSFTMANPFPSPVAPYPSAVYLDPHNRTSYLEQLNLVIERELPGGMVGEVAFQDQTGHKLQAQWDSNNPLPGPGSLVSRRPFYPDFQSVAWVFAHEGHNHYDDMELSLRKTGPHYTFWWNHTWAKNIGRDTDQYGSDIVNPYDRNQFVGPVRYAPNNDKLSFVVDLPAGKGRKLLNRGGVLNAVVGGWTASGLFTLYQQDTPLTIWWSGDTADIGIYSVRPNRVCNGNLSNPTNQRYFDASCFVAPTTGTVGNSGTGIINNPGWFMYSGDFGFFKSFDLKEKAKLQFRSEFYNVFNHPNHGEPGTTANGPNFGVVQYPSLTPRTVQLALRLTF